MIDISSEKILPLREAAKLVPSARLGRPCTFQCILRWVLNGTRAPDGQNVKLDALRLGGRWITSREALQRFAESLTPQASPPKPTKTTKQRQRAADKAEAELTRLGI
jgi:hypothetical protein